MKPFVLGLFLATACVASPILTQAHQPASSVMAMDDCPACGLSDSAILAAGRSQGLWGGSAMITARVADGAGGQNVTVVDLTTQHVHVTVKNDFIIIIDVID